MKEDALKVISERERDGRKKNIYRMAKRREKTSNE